MKRLELCLSCDDNYAKYAATVIYSVLANKNEDDEIVFHILYSNLLQENINKLSFYKNVVFHKVDSALFEPYFNNGVCKNVTVATLYRLMLPELLPNIDRIIYLDCDLIVLDSLSELFFVTLDDNEYAACVPDLALGSHMKRMNFETSCKNFYFNAGVCMLDLQKMRRDNIQQQMFSYLYKNWDKLSYCDQDVMNAVLLGKVKKMDRKFNFITPNFYFVNYKNPPIVHFAGVKPWHVGFYNNYRELFWKYFMQTPFADDKGQKRIKKTVFFMHKKPCQFFWFFKMYPLFFLKSDRILNFKRIVKNLEFDY